MVLFLKIFLRYRIKATAITFKSHIYKTQRKKRYVPVRGRSETKAETSNEPDVQYPFALKVKRAHRAYFVTGSLDFFFIKPICKDRESCSICF